jgi:hypothetical protein
MNGYIVVSNDEDTYDRVDTVYLNKEKAEEVARSDSAVIFTMIHKKAEQHYKEQVAKRELADKLSPEEVRSLNIYVPSDRTLEQNKVAAETDFDTWYAFSPYQAYHVKSVEIVE